LPSTGHSLFTQALTLRNAGEAFALGVRLHAPDGRQFCFNDNYLILPPGEGRTIGVVGAAEEVRVTGWNIQSDER
jgi:hypothetical protein